MALSDAVIEQMRLYSWKPGCPVSFDELHLLTITHWGYDDQSRVGELIVHERLAEEVLAIFEELYAARFPIEKIRLIDAYQGDDNASMADNNSSAFCFREAVAKPGILSKHSFGAAIDINPLYNPYVRGELILPPEGKPFLDRSLSLKGMITEISPCYHAFVKRGWTWGGSWPDRQDYQHFEKWPL